MAHPMTQVKPNNIKSENLDKSDKSEKTDVWVGLKDRAERRKIQNRLNQRARRKRQRLQSQSKDIHPKSVVASAASSTSPSSSSTALSKTSSTNTWTPISCPDISWVRNVLEQFADVAFKSYTLGSPTSDHLLTLTKVNVFRAFGHNMRLTGGDINDMDDDAISKFSTPSPILQHEQIIPPSLQPTKIQRTVPHHPWLDFFPIPKMRDNLIQAGEDWNDGELCLDIMGFWNHSSADAGLLVWGEPWDARNWELTESFLKKWLWVIRGCPELMNSTNAWRAKRGEKLIFRYV